MRDHRRTNALVVAEQWPTSSRGTIEDDVTAGVVSVGTSRPSGQAPGIIVDAYANIGGDIGTLTSGISGNGGGSASNVVASSEMVLQMLDTLMTGHEPFYADYPAYQEAEPLAGHHPHHQHSHHHAIIRSNGSAVPSVSLDATTHTPGIPYADFYDFPMLRAGNIVRKKWEKKSDETMKEKKEKKRRVQT